MHGSTTAIVTPHAKCICFNVLITWVYNFHQDTTGLTVSALRILLHGCTTAIMTLQTKSIVLRYLITWIYDSHQDSTDSVYSILLHGSSTAIMTHTLTVYALKFPLHGSITATMSTQTKCIGFWNLIIWIYDFNLVSIV